MRSFGSDNHSGVHPRIMEALMEVNHHHAIAYGDDPCTGKAKEIIRTLLNDESLEPLFLFNGTGANVVALQACTLPFHSILCAATAHIAVDECGAPVKFTGATLKEIDTPDGKLTPELVRPHLHGFGVAHHSQPKVIAISQTTELGTAYTPKEMKALSTLAHEHGMYLFVDGTRIANACALGANLKMTSDCGGYIHPGRNQNGLMFGEALVALHPNWPCITLLPEAKHPALLQMRYIAAQFIPYLEEEIWIANARHSNRAARRLAEGMERLPGEDNATGGIQRAFLHCPRTREKLREDYFTTGI